MSEAGLDNPYATPRAPLEREEAPLERPREMRWIVLLAWISFGLDVLDSVLDTQTMPL